MKYFYDCEFIEDGKTIDLISIGIVAEDGRELYAESIEADLLKASDWVKENVLPYLWSKQKDKKQANGWSRDGGKGGLLFRKDIRGEIERFCDTSVYGKPELWGYYSSYDHVALCQLFGTMMDLPKGWPMYTRDLRQWADSLGITEDLDKIIPAEGEHHALADARWNKKAWEYLQSL